MQQRGVTSAQDDRLPRQYPDIIRIRETVGIFEMDIRDVEVPLKIKIIRTGDEYSGLANFAVREKGAKDYYRDTGSNPSKEAALNGAVAVFPAPDPGRLNLGRSRIGKPDIRTKKAATSRICRITVHVPSWYVCTSVTRDLVEIRLNWNSCPRNAIDRSADHDGPHLKCGSWVIPAVLPHFWCITVPALLCRTNLLKKSLDVGVPESLAHTEGLASFERVLVLRNLLVCKFAYEFEAGLDLLDGLGLKDASGHCLCPDCVTDL